MPEPGVPATAPSVSVKLPDAEPDGEARPTKLPEASASLGAAALLQTPGSKGRRTAARLREKIVRLLPGKKPVRAQNIDFFLFLSTHFYTVPVRGM